MLRRHPGLWIVPALCAGAVVLGFGDWAERGPVLCVWRLTTGLPCGGCGLTRGFAALAHGHWQAALDFNLLTPFVFAWMATWWLAAVWRLARGLPIAAAPAWLPRGALAVVLAYWVARDAWWLAQPDVAARLVAHSPLLQRVVPWLW